MARKNVLQWNLSEKELNFLINTAAPESSDKEELKQCVKNDPSFRKSIIANENVFNSVKNKTPLNLSISLRLYFEVLLRGATQKMQESTHTVERSSSMKIPVFDLKETLEFLQEENTINYLAHLLFSFVALNKGNLNDIDIDALASLGKNADELTRFFIYKRIGDVCLFILGIMPEYVIYDYHYLFSKEPMPITAGPKRSISEYEGWGQKFYDLASKEKSAEITGLDEVLQKFSYNFNLAKKPLNFLSEHCFRLAQHKKPESR